MAVVHEEEKVDGLRHRGHLVAAFQRSTGRDQGGVATLHHTHRREAQIAELLRRQRGGLIVADQKNRLGFIEAEAAQPRADAPARAGDVRLAVGRGAAQVDDRT